MSKNASVKSVKGRITVEGIHTVFEADGVTVKDRKAMLKVNKSIFSERFLVPLGLFTLEQLTDAMTSADAEFFPVDTEMEFNNVTKVEGKFRTYEARVTSVFRPMSEKALADLVSSQTIVKKP